MKNNEFYLCGEEVKEKPYLYRSCGLEGIYLLNGYSIEEYDGAEYVSIRDVEGLHKAIGQHIVLNRKALTPKEIRFLRNTLDLTQAELAHLIGNNSQSVARWEKGECEMPGASEKLLRAIYLAFVTNQDGSLLTLLTSRLSELDDMDETSIAPAQFTLFDQWTDKAA